MVAGMDRYLATKQRVESLEFPNTFRELIDRAAEQYGDRPAINFFEMEQQCSYQQLRDQVYALADGLHQKGVGKGSHVALMMSNRIEFPLTWLAFGVLGAVMIPINTRYTSSELDYVFNDGDVDFVVLEDQFLPVLDGMEQRPQACTDAHVIVVGDAEGSSYPRWADVQASGRADFVTSWDVSAEDLINIQYTSGTTGFPKGCMQTQSYWTLMGAAIFESLVEPVASILTDHSYFYMDPLWQLTMGLYGGATVYAASRLSASQFLPRVQKFEIEFAWFPRPLISSPANPEERNTKLKKMFIGGASAEGIRNIRERFGVKVSDGYGMTEIGPGLAVADEIEDDDILGTCGVPAAYRECKVVREDGTECDANEPGELWVRGNGVFKGYYNKPEANAESFVDDWFRTGDTFIKTEKGFFKIIGRIKDMIRRSSENISALEVEMAVITHPDVELAAALPVPDDYRGEEVKIYVMLRGDATQETLPPENIIAHCESRLAAFKVPRYVEYVSELPLTPTLKVSKPKLKQVKEDLRIGSWDHLEKTWH